MSDYKAVIRVEAILEFENALLKETNRVLEDHRGQTDEPAIIIVSAIVMALLDLDKRIPGVLRLVKEILRRDDCNGRFK